MSTLQMKIAGAGLFFLFIFFFGFWLSRSGKPYNVVIFTIHKLITLGAVVFLTLTVYRVHQAAPLSPAQTSAVLVTALCFVVTIITGALLSLDQALPWFVSRLHQFMPYLTVLSSAVTLYLILAKSSAILKTWN